MKSSSSTTIGILTVALMVSSLFLSSFFVSPVSAQAGAIVVSGKSTAHNINAGGVDPDNWYTSSPPIMAAQRIGLGAVVAGGIASTCRNGVWDNLSNPSPHLDVFLDVAFKWMVPTAENVLWYEGYGVYNTAARCSELVSALENLDYHVNHGSTQPITSSLLASYDILVIPQLELGSGPLGGDPTLLPDANVAAIKSFVEGGKGVFIMEQSSYQGYNYCKVPNKIFTGLGFDYWFQHDQAADNVDNWGGADFRLITDVNTATPIGSAYQARTGSTEIGLYSVCTLEPAIPPPEHQVSVSSSNGGQLGNPGASLTFPMTIKNTGTKPDTYTLTVGGNLAWSLSISMTSVSLASDNSAQFNVGVVIPASLTEKTADEIVVSAVGASGAKDNVTLIASAHVPTEHIMYNGQIVPTRELLPGEIYYWFSANTIQVGPPAAPIMCATDTGYGTNTAAGQTTGAPWPMLYGVGEYPPIAAVQLVGTGRVLACGGLPILRSLPVEQFTDSRLASVELMPLMVRWLINWENPVGKKFLFYYTTAAFHGPSNLYEWLNMVENELGFELTIQEGGSITPELLAGYDVLQTVTEAPISDANTLAIANWVENGGALLLMEQGNYGGFGNVPTTNKILETLGCNIRFNYDELYDPAHYIKDGPWFPQVYLENVTFVNPNFDVWFPATAGSSKIPESTQFGVWKPGVVGKGNDEPVNFKFVITNIGTEATTYVTEVKETTATPLGWPTSMDQTEVTVPAGENREVIITVTVPSVAENQIKRTNWTATATAQGLPFVRSESDFTAVAEYGQGPTPGVSWPTIAAAIAVVLAVIAIIAYWAIKIR
jgi:hypothetical protein